MGEGGDSSDVDEPGPEPRPMPIPSPPSDAGFLGLEYEMTPLLEKMRLQSRSQKTASPQAVADTVPGRPLASSARGPIDGFAPLARNKSAGVWEWGV